MKNIAKGIVVFLTILILLFGSVICSFAVNDESTKIQTTANQKTETQTDNQTTANQETETQTDNQTTANQETETQTGNQGTEAYPNIEVSLDATTAVKANMDGYTLTIQNQSNKKIRGIKTVINVGGEYVTIRYRKVLKGFESYNINVEDYFSRDFLEGKKISIQVEDCMTWIGFVIYLIISIGIIVFFIYLTGGESIGIILLLAGGFFLVGIAFGF